MYLNKHKIETHIAFRALAMLVVLALALWMVGAFPFSKNVEAANITSVSDTLTDSDLGVVSNHTIRFTTPNGLLASQTILITFPTSPDSFLIPTGLDHGDVDISLNGVDSNLATSSAAGLWGFATTSTTVQLTAPSDAGVSSSTIIVIEIGTNATSQYQGGTQLTNPDTTGSYEITIGGSMADSGATRVAILDNVLVTAQVDTSFSFTVNGNATGTPVNGTTTTKTSSATEIPFGLLTANVIDTIAQQLHVSTNAANGFAVTVMQDTNFLSSTGADIDGFIDGAYTDDPTAWAAPTNNISNEWTWGHWGLTSEDDVVAGGGAFGSNEWISASTTPRTIFAHSGPSDGSTADIGSTTIGYQVQITSLQEAGDDYNTTLTYVATPTF